MSSSYFSELKEWSVRKHELLTKYLDGFVRILGGATKSLVFYIDGFAGPGLYDDGKEGSPVLAAKYAQSLSGRHYSLYCINVEIDQVLFNNLECNTLPYGTFIMNRLGAFGDHVDWIINYIGSRPAIFFLDPFGVKGIEWRHISKVLKRPYTTEFLLRISPNDIGRLAGFLDSESQEAAGKCQLLTDLYGFSDSGQWEQAWPSRRVEGLVDLYIERLGQGMLLGGKRSYRCSYPIRTIDGELKYHLVFATRHPKGAVLMNDTIYNREETYELEVREYQNGQSLRQLSMLDIIEPMPTEEEITKAKVDELKADIWRKFQGKTARRLDIRTAMLEKWFGRVKGPHFTRAFKEMKQEGKITKHSGPVFDPNTYITFKG